MTPFLLALSIAFQTQTSALVDPNEAEFHNVFSELGGHQTLLLQLNGSVTYKSKTTPIVSNLSWNQTTVPNGAGGQKQAFQVEIDEAVNGILTKRIVGDGDTLWSYDVVAHEYSATSYGGSGAVRTDHYLSDLLSYVNQAATGQTAYLTKLVRQINNVNLPYISWMPGVFSIGLPQNVQTLDPINPNVVYTPTPTDYYYIYNGAPKRSITFHIVPPQSSSGNQPDLLKDIYLNQIETVAKLPRYTQWTITPYPDMTFSGDLFKPYSGAQTLGWRPVVGPKAVVN